MPNLRQRTKSLRFSPNAQRFVAPSGKFLSPDSIRAVIDEDIQATGARMAKHTAGVQASARQYLAGEIEEAEYHVACDTFRAAMRDEVKYLHLAEVAAAKGGLAGMDSPSFGFAGQRIQFHSGKLDAWIGELKADPKMATNEAPGRLPFERRLDAYAQAGRNTFEWMREKEHVAHGFGFCENELEDSAHHCKGPNSCRAQTDKGRVAVGGLVRVGERTCRHECKCTMNYFKEAPPEA